jgi:putative endonuclease
VPWFVYLARCADDTLYCGITNDVAARLAAHNAGRGARYTRSRRPIQIVLVRRCATKSRALRLEYLIKQLTRAGKRHLLAGPDGLDALARRLARRPISPPRGSGRRRAGGSARSGRAG